MSTEGGAKEGAEHLRGDAAGALAGIRIADFSRVLAGPLCTMILADMGAEVIKIERPGSGDESREWGPPFVGDDISSYYGAVNRNKASVALDLRDPVDRRRALVLAKDADIVVENFRPGTMERLGLGYEVLAAANPALIYCAVSAFGRGRGAGMAGYDFLLQASGGLMSITGEPDGTPMKVGVALVDVIAGLYATIGILAAVRERSVSGRGQRVDVSLLSSVLAALVNQGSAYVMTGEAPQRMGNTHPSVAPYELFDSADHPLVLAIGNDRHFSSLVEVLGVPELAADQRFGNNRSRVANIEVLRETIQRQLRTAGRDEWVRRLTDVGIACGPVNDVGQAFELAEQLGLEPIVEMRSDEGEELSQVANPLSFSRTPVSYRKSPPPLGDTPAEGIGFESKRGA